MCMLDERGIQGTRHRCLFLIFFSHSFSNNSNVCQFCSGSWVLTSLVGFLVIYFFLHAAAILHRKKNELQQLMKGPNKLMLTYQATVTSSRPLNRIYNYSILISPASFFLALPVGMFWKQNLSSFRSFSSRKRSHNLWAIKL